LWVRFGVAAGCEDIRDEDSWLLRTASAFAQIERSIKARVSRARCIRHAQNSAFSI
jgi:hypothetical protein